MKKILSLSLLGLLSNIFWLSAAEIRGNYSSIGVIPTKNSLTKVRFEEFINFGCPHCNNLHNASKNLRKKYADTVDFVDIPITFRGQDDAPLRLYYVAASIGKGDLVKNELFKTNFEYGVNVFDPGIVNYLAKSLNLGDLYQKESKKAWVTQKIQEGMQKADLYQVRGTPTIVLQDSMKIEAGDYGSWQNFVSQIPATFDDLLIK